MFFYQNDDADDDEGYEGGEEHKNWNNEDGDADPGAAADDEENTKDVEMVTKADGSRVTGARYLTYPTRKYLNGKRKRTRNSRKTRRRTPSNNINTNTTIKQFKKTACAISCETGTNKHDLLQ